MGKTKQPNQSKKSKVSKKTWNSESVEKAPVSRYCWVPAWALQKDTGNESFEELELDKIKGPQEKKEVKRRKIDATTKVITEKICAKKYEMVKRKEKTKRKKHKKYET